MVETRTIHLFQSTKNQNRCRRNLRGHGSKTPRWLNHPRPSIYDNPSPSCSPNTLTLSRPCVRPFKTIPCLMRANMTIYGCYGLSSATKERSQKQRKRVNIRLHFDRSISWMPRIFGSSLPRGLIQRHGVSWNAEKKACLRLTCRILREERSPISI